MSRPISFRLEEDDTINPDEARALGILQAWRAKGWEPRELLTRLLLNLEGIEPVNRTDQLVADFQDLIHELKGQATATGVMLNDLRAAVDGARAVSSDLGMVQDIWQALNEIRQLAAAPRNPELPAPKEPEQPVLKEEFLASVKKGARPGMRRQG
jgi:hypothetical protein